MLSCEECREALSARLDGEDDPVESSAVDAHLADCPDCRDWTETAARVTRLARTSSVGSPITLDDKILAAAPGPGRARIALALRGLLGALGAVQLVLGVVQITDGARSQSLHGSHILPGVGPGHLWHESAAWNVALGVGFLWIALRRTRPTGLLPTLTMFVGLLTLLSANDVLADRVDLRRLLSHGFVVAGYLIIVALSRPALDPGPPPADGRDHRPRWRVSFDEPESPATRPPLRLLPPTTVARAWHDRPARRRGLAA